MKTIWYITHLSPEEFAAGQQPGVDWCPISLPCSVQNSPFGLPPNELYQRERIHEVEWMRQSVWLYRTRLPAVSVGLDEEAVYRFLGIDYACQIFLNGEKVLEHEGMFSMVEAPLPNLTEGDELLVAILPFAEDRAYPENAKARCTTGNGWDFAPKIQSAGIWDDAELLICKRLRVTGAHVKTDIANAQRADVIVSITLSEKASGLVTVELDGIRRVCPLVDADQLAVPLNIPSPTLWWPNGLGQPALLELKVTLDGTGWKAEPFTQKVGLREVRRIPCEGQGQEDIPLQLVINGQKVFIQGVNWVPPDACPGSITTERYRLFLTQFQGAGVNFVRVWGGGLKEKDSFYDLCDELGLMVMQEFPLACQTIARTERFYRILSQETAAILQRLRHHPSVVIWSGGNEHYHYWDAVDSGTAHMEAIREDVKKLFALGDTDTANREWRGGCPKYDEPALTLLGHLCAQLDGSRPYQITSGMEGEGEAHGIWTWNPAIGDHRFRDYASLYDYWQQAKAHLFSECSVSSIANLETIQHVTGETNPTIPSSDDPIWKLHHAFHAAWDNLPDLWLDIPSTERLFGKLDDLETLIAANQWMQGEGGRFLVEEIRRKIGVTSGVIWWGVNEPWPGLAGNALIDYFGRPKASWPVIANAWRPITLSLRYDHCVTRRFKPELWISNILSNAFIGSYRVTVANLKTGQEDVYMGKVSCSCYQACYLKTLTPMRMYTGTRLRVECLLYDDASMHPIHTNQYVFASDEDAAPMRWFIEI